MMIFKNKYRLCTPKAEIKKGRGFLAVVAGDFLRLKSLKNHALTTGETPGPLTRTQGKIWGNRIFLICVPRRTIAKSR